MGRPLSPSVIACACAAAALGCAHAPRATSFEDAGLLAVVDTSGAPTPPPVKVIAPRSIAAEPVDGPPVDGILVRFSGEARARRARPPDGRGFPEDAARAWRALARDLDLYLGRPLPQTPLLELVRARVTVDAEWDLDRRRFGPAPDALAAEVAARAHRLAARVATARALREGLVLARRPATLRWPIEGAGLSSAFGVRADPFTGERRMHSGVDLAADQGRAVFSAAKGLVVRAGWTSGYGLLVEIRHAGDVTTRYSHLSKVLCTPGDAVDAGQALGLVGATGRATGPHLHFEVWRGGRASDPLAWLGGAASVAAIPASAAGGF